MSFQIPSFGKRRSPAPYEDEDDSSDDDSAVVTPDDPVFEPFTRLPMELRMNIWHHAMADSRIVKVTVTSHEEMDRFVNNQGHPKFEQTPEHKAQKYGVIVNGYQLMSVCFRVSRESRKEAKIFYRAHIPVWLIRGGNRTNNIFRPGILHFNPEHDFLYLSGDSGKNIEFVHDLKAVYDPLRVGLLNVAMDRRGMLSLKGFHTIDPLSLDPVVREGFCRTLTQLKNVYCMQFQDLGRIVLGLRDGASEDVYTFNRAFPIAPESLRFDLIGPDPRHGSFGLKSTFLTANPRCMIAAWRETLAIYLGDWEGNVVEERVVLAYGQLPSEIWDHYDGAIFLNSEERTWELETVEGGHPIKETTVSNVYGFWVFKPETFGDLSPDDLDPDPFEDWSRYMNLSQPRPELACVILPA